MRVQGINPVCGKLKFRGAKDTETFFMHKSISVWLSKTHRTCRFCLNACCQGPRRLHFPRFTHSTLGMQILSRSLLPCLSGSSAPAALDVPTTGPRSVNGSQVQTCLKRIFQRDPPQPQESIDLVAPSQLSRMLPQRQDETKSPCECSQFFFLRFHDSDLIFFPISKSVSF